MVSAANVITQVWFYKQLVRRALPALRINFGASLIFQHMVGQRESFEGKVFCEKMLESDRCEFMLLLSMDFQSQHTFGNETQTQYSKKMVFFLEHG